jgi:hypothetical protein
VGERRHRLQSPRYGDERGGSKEPQAVPTPTPTPTPVQVYIEPNTTTVAPGQQFAVDVSVKGTTAQTVVAEFTFDASKAVYVTKSTYGPFSFVSSVSGNRVSVAGISDTDNFFLERFTSFRIIYTTIVKFLRASSALLESTDIMVPELKTMTIPFQFFLFYCSVALILYLLPQICVDLNLQFFKPQKLIHAVPLPDLRKPNDGWGELNKRINGIMAY